MKTRTGKALGVVAAIAAIALSLPLAITAYAEPPAEPTPVAEIPDPQGPGCDAVQAGSCPTSRAWRPSRSARRWPASRTSAPSTPRSRVSSTPRSTSSPVLDNGPYVVFAPTNEAFAKLPPEQLDALKADPAALTELDLLPRVPRPARSRRCEGPAAHAAGRGDQGGRQGRRHQGQRHRQGRLRRHPGQQRTDLPDRHGPGPGGRPGRRSRAVDHVDDRDDHGTTTTTTEPPAETSARGDAASTETPAALAARRCDIDTWALIGPTTTAHSVDLGEYARLQTEVAADDLLHDLGGATEDRLDRGRRRSRGRRGTPSCSRSRRAAARSRRSPSWRFRCTTTSPWRPRPRSAHRRRRPAGTGRCSCSETSSSVSISASRKRLCWKLPIG